MAAARILRATAARVGCAFALGRIECDDVLPVLQPLLLTRVDDFPECVAYVGGHDHDECARFDAVAELWKLKLGEAALA
jgi:hypothetical protein